MVPNSMEHRRGVRVRYSASWLRSLRDVLMSGTGGRERFAHDVRMMIFRNFWARRVVGSGDTERHVAAARVSP